ncbi:uncharacterized protein LOC128378637 [Scomber japonicus]|uniref:uncharacterized protein LOC128378637 n=1 Tax=Scomber japonicus TaxID=13676 RepID=UPI002304DA8D|nr:uncharacterized protein LOC128378637 [Scomber japonicus]
MLHPYAPPPDPLHVTLFYDRDENWVYHEAFMDVEGKGSEVTSTCLFAGPEGVAAAVTLPYELIKIYEMAAEAAPHITLAVHADHQAKELGPMTKRLLKVSDWVTTQIPQLSYSESEKAYKITKTAVDSVLLEQRQIERFHGREKTDHPDSSSMLEALPPSLWSSGPTDVGFCSTIDPITFDVKPDAGPIWLNQYPHKQVAEEGIADTIEGLLAAGVLIDSSSNWNTPILPVEKQNTGKFRMAHDLRSINTIITTATLPVPNPYIALSRVTPSHQWFTCIDLANAFFCLPLAPALRHIFSFTYQGRQFTYSRLPQGFILSPGIFNHVLKDLLAGVELPQGSVLVQYVDDLLIASPSPSVCLAATDVVLRRLFEVGFKVSKKKLQCCRQLVSFLGCVISGKGTGVSPAHKDSILHHTKPQKVKDMLSFLGLTGYSRHFVPAYVELTAPLRAMVNSKGMRNLTATLEWDEVAERSFITLKQLMSNAIALAVPDYTLPFYLDVSEKPRSVNGVLFQKKGGDRKILTYASVTLDATENRQPPCTRHAAGVAKILNKTAHIVMGHPITVLTTHSVVAYVNSQAFTMTSLRQTRLEKTLTAPHITFTHEGINMADNMGEGEPHVCEERVQKDVRIRSDLQGEPINRAEETLFTDGCCFRHPTEGLKAAWAVVRTTPAGFETILSGKVKGKESAQLAELQAMIAALEWSEGKSVNIYTDSAYVVGAIHVELSQWMRAGFLTASKTPIKHEKDIKRLTEVLMKPRLIAVIKCKGHDKTDSLTAKGNDAADQAAKQEAGYGVQYTMIQSEKTIHDLVLSPCQEDVVGLEQEKASPQEKSVWINKGARKSEGIWRAPDGRPVLPPGLTSAVLQEAHGLTHCGSTQMKHHLTHWWHPYLPAAIENHIRECSTCKAYNVKPTIKPHQGKFPLPPLPGQEIIIDYTDMLINARGYRYLLVAVDAYTGWPEAVPTKKEDALTVVKFLLNQYIPTHGFPKKIRSDNGTHFKNKHLQAVEAQLGLKHAFGTVYHPQSQGKVERMNQTIKGKIGKICADSKLNWVDALPIALMSIRSSVNSITGFTPYELMCGQQFPGPGAGGVICQTIPFLEYKPYYDQLTALVSVFSKQVAEIKGGEEKAPPPRDTKWVLLKVFKRKWSEPRWTGPYQVTERTSHAVRLKGKGETWFHWSMCTATDPPTRTMEEIRKDLKELS